MELVRLVAALAERDAAVRLANERTVLFRCTDADTVVVAASMSGRLTQPLGVWLVVGESYPAQLAARDAATLAALVPLRHVVIEASSLSREHADVVRALLTNDEVNFTNAVATLVGAFNRPAPPSPLTVWSYDGERLVDGVRVLSPGRVVTSAAGELTDFV
ncbi:MAG TPA: hypothetical protein VNF08_04145 [Acidimicrobiales bacterium]|nr:hypothetical protein [Acidimicrobiales bacterium]